MKMIMSVVCRKSKKDEPYTALSVDLGYTKKIVTFDTALIVEMTGISFANLASMKIGDEIQVLRVESL